MTLADIIANIDLIYPNSFSVEDKITFMNNVQIPKEILPEIAPKEVLHFKTYILPDGTPQQIYSETVGIDFRNIESVVVDGEEYVRKYPNDEVEDESTKWYAECLNGYLFLYPPPADGQDVYVTYYRKLDKLTEEDLQKELNVKDEYIELLKLGVLASMAKANGDVALANNFIQDFNDLVFQIRANQNYQAAQDEFIKDVLGW